MVDIYHIYKGTRIIIRDYDNIYMYNIVYIPYIYIRDYNPPILAGKIPLILTTCIVLAYWVIIYHLYRPLREPETAIELPKNVSITP